MTPDRWRRIEEIYHSALERKPDERGAFLDGACGGDQELRREVESLLAPAGSLLDRPAWETLELKPGARFSSYEIVAKLGEGGMGVVYRAQDAKLNRPVAIKLLSDELADAAARRRFQREAQTASSLNHPHILTVYDVGEFEGRQYLVTEFVDGGTLTGWARAEPRTWRQILELLSGVADGLAAAHQAGILHRDIKPDNILISKSGYAKLADFGLAKLTDTSAGDKTKTMQAGATRPGTILGTIAYMSPEQASGRSTDARSDIFSFGVVLSEVLAGHRPFTGNTDLEVLQKIIHAPPEPLNADLPPALEAVVEKALEKEPADRYQSMRELVVDMRRIARKESQEVARPVRAPGIDRPRLASKAAVLASLILAVGGLAGWYAKSWFAARAPAVPVQVQRLTNMVGLEETPAISPDGKIVAFVAVAGGWRQIWVRLISGGAPLAITKDDVDHYGPRWAPDSGSLIYYTPGRQGGQAGTLWEIPALGGTARRLATALGPGDLSHNGKNVAFFRFQDDAIELAVAERDGSATRRITKLVNGLFTIPRWSPDDRRIAFLIEPGGDVFAKNLMLVDAAGGEARQVASDFYFQGFGWTPDGAGVIASSAQGSTMAYPPTNNLWYLPIGSGRPAQLTFGESSYEFPDVNGAGQIVASHIRTTSDIWRIPIDGEPSENVRRGARITRQTGQIQTVTMNPDESEVAFLSDNGGHANVWVARVADGEMRPITQESDPSVTIAVPAWSPRGDYINYLSNRNTRRPEVTLWLARPDGSEARDLGTLGAWACWSHDGSWLYFSDQARGIYRIRKLPVDGGQPVTVRDDNAVACTVADGTLYYAKVLTQATGSWDLELRAAKPENGPSLAIGSVSSARVPIDVVNFQAYVSPDGKWLATPLLDGSTTNLWALSTSGGGWRKLTDFGSRNVLIARRIAWSRDGKSLYAPVSDIDADIVRLSGLKWR